MLSRATLDCERWMLSFCSQRCLERAHKQEIVSNGPISSSSPNCLTGLPFSSFYQRLFCKGIRLQDDCSGPWGHREAQARSQNLSPSSPTCSLHCWVSGRRRIPFCRPKWLHVFGGFPFHPGGGGARLRRALQSQAGEQKGQELSPRPGVQRPC